MPIQPDWFKKQIAEMRGSSIYGDPILRVTWGPDERDFRGRYKYVNPEGGVMERWILERWQPAGFFGSRKVWEDTNSFYDDVTQDYVNLKGPFPERGAYTMVCPLVGNEGQFVALDETVMAGIRSKVKKDEEFAGLQAIERNDLVMDQHKAQESTREYEADKRQENIRDYWLSNWDKINRSTARGYSITPR